MRRCWAWGLSVWLLFSVGCAFPDRKEEFKFHSQADNKALIYLYRLDHWSLSADPDVPRFFLNEEFIGKLKLGSYYAVEVSPGPVTIYSKDSLFLIPFWWKKNKLEFNAEPGQQYFVRYQKIWGFFGNTENAVLVPQHLGLSEIKPTRELERCKSIMSCP